MLTHQVSSMLFNQKKAHVHAASNTRLQYLHQIDTLPPALYSSRLEWWRCRDHPELSELLCVEMMRRQQDGGGKAAHHHVLTCLPPWMDNLSFAARWEGACVPLLITK